MDIFVYSDESGVFDVVHNDLFVFGGLILLGKDAKDTFVRKYSHAERILRQNSSFPDVLELKAINLDNSQKHQLYRSLNKIYKFGVVINQKEILPQIFDNKKSKQRYLDFAYKIALKRAFQDLINKGLINIDEVEIIHVFVDEHTTATDGRYELKIGTFNSDYLCFFPPLFPDMKCIDLKYCDSASVKLIRAADIIANRIFYLARNNQLVNVNLDNMNIVFLPRNI